MPAGLNVDRDSLQIGPSENVTMGHVSKKRRIDGNGNLSPSSKSSPMPEGTYSVELDEVGEESSTQSLHGSAPGECVRMVIHG